MYTSVKVQKPIEPFMLSNETMYIWILRDTQARYTSLSLPLKRKLPTETIRFVLKQTNFYATQKALYVFLL